MFHALKLLGLGLGASEFEVKIWFRQMVREYHPDKNNQEVTGLIASIGLLQIFDNANMFLRVMIDLWNS